MVIIYLSLLDEGISSKIFGYVDPPHKGEVNKDSLDVEFQLMIASQ